MRSYTIDAENEEEYIQEYERIRKSRLSELTFKEKHNDDIEILEPEEDSLKPKNNPNLNDLDDEYSGLGAFKEEDEEDYFEKDNYDDSDIIKGSEDEIVKKENNEEKGIELLCYYLKHSINELSKEKIINNKECIFYRNNKSIKALSGNAIYDINMRDLVDNLLTKNDNEYMKSNDGNNNSLRDYIFQNI